MPRYPREVLDDLKEHVDIVHLINSYGVELKKNGSRFKGLCPFHNERTPSFNVSPSSAFFHCFGCGEGGDAFAFVQKIDHTSFAQAVEQLAHAYGYTLPELEQATAEEEAAAELRRKILALLEASKDWMHNAYNELPQSHVARQQLQKRQLESPELVDEFSIGYCPEGWDRLTSAMKEHGFDDEALLESGMSIRTSKGGLIDRFRGRLMWSIGDIQGRTVGFGGRKLYEDDQGGKYVNSPETPVYHKKRILYNLDRARKAISQSGTVFVVEGYTDVMACWSAGIHNVVASSGTAFTEEHINMLRRLLDGYGDGSVGRIVYCFDGDAAGQKAARATLDLGTALQARSYVITIPDNMDPCDYRMAHSDEKLHEFFVTESNRQTLVDFVLEREAKSHDITNANGRIVYLEACLPILRRIEQEELQIQAMRRVSYLSGVKIAQVEKFMNENRVTVERVEDEPVSQQSSPLAMVQKKILATLLQYPRFVNVSEKAGLVDEDFLSEDYQILYYQALGYAHNPHSSHFDDEKLVSELFTMNIVPDGSEPSEYSFYSWVETLQSARRSESRREAIQRMYGMTEEGYQGTAENDFFAAGEVAQMQVNELNRQEESRNRVLPARKSTEQGTKKNAAILLENIIKKKQ